MAKGGNRVVEVITELEVSGARGNGGSTWKVAAVIVLEL